MIETQDRLPRCFGKAWDDTAAACAGGLDPTYKDPETGSRLRERCAFFSTCGARTQAMKMHQQIIPVQQIVRPPITPPVQQGPIPSSPSTMMPTAQSMQIQQLMNQVAQLQQVVQQQNAQLQRQHNGYPTSQFNGLMTVDYRMPSYLSVPEPKGDSVWSMLGRAVMRSAFKSVGHTLANFWDTTPLGREEEK